MAMGPSGRPGPAPSSARRWAKSAWKGTPPTATSGSFRRRPAACCPPAAPVAAAPALASAADSITWNVGGTVPSAVPPFSAKEADLITRSANACFAPSPEPHAIKGVDRPTAAMIDHGHRRRVVRCPVVVTVAPPVAARGWIEMLVLHPAEAGGIARCASAYYD